MLYYAFLLLLFIIQNTVAAGGLYQGSIIRGALQAFNKKDCSCPKTFIIVHQRSGKRTAGGDGKVMVEYANVVR